MGKVDLDSLFIDLKELLQSFDADATLELREETIGTQAKEKKAALHLYGKAEVSISGRKAQQTYIAGVIRQKHYVGFYSMPIYSHPKQFKLSAALDKARSGKSCFHIKTDDPTVHAELKELLSAGIELYRNEGWV